MHEVLVNRLGGLSLPRKSVVRLTDRPDMTLDVYRGRKTTMQQQQQRVVSHTDWGADRKVLLNLYRTIIRSKLDYGSIIYGSARKSYLEMLDPIHHQGLRLALGAFRTSPSESLLAEANEPSLYNRRLKLSMQYALKLKSNPSNPTYETVFEPQYKTLFENKPTMIPSFGIRLSSEFENMNLDLNNIADFKI